MRWPLLHCDRLFCFRPLQSPPRLLNETDKEEMAPIDKTTIDNLNALADRLRINSVLATNASKSGSVNS